MHQSIKSKMSSWAAMFETYFTAIHHYTLAHPMARWLASKLVGWGVIGFGVAVAQWDEYGLALFLFAAGSLILLLQAYYWQGPDNYPRLSKTLRVAFIGGAVVMIISAYPITNAKRGDKPWSDTIAKIRTKKNKREGDAIIKTEPPPPQPEAKKDIPSTSESKKESPTFPVPSKPAFDVQIDTAVMAEYPKKLDGSGTPFWIAYSNNTGKILSPATVVLVIRVTNLQGHPVTVAKYSVSVGKIKMVKLGGPPTESFYNGYGNIHAFCWINNSDLLDKNLGAKLEPGIPVQGLALFDYPTESRPDVLTSSDLDSVKFTVWITDVEGHTFVSKPIHPICDPLNGNIHRQLIEFNRGTWDVSGFAVRYFEIPRTVISGPF